MSADQGQRACEAAAAQRRDPRVQTPKRDAGRSAGGARRRPPSRPPTKIIVVDDRSTDRTAEIAVAPRRASRRGCERRLRGRRRAQPRLGCGRRRCRRLPRRRRRTAARLHGRGRAGPPASSRARSWACARRFAPHTRPGRGSPTCRSRRPIWSAGRAARRALRLVLLHARAAFRFDLRFDESYGGEDAVFSADALRARHPARLRSALTRRCTTTTATRSRSCAGQQSRTGVRGRRASVRCSARGHEQAHHEPRTAALLSHFLRLPVIYRRLDEDPQLRRRFVRLLPLMGRGGVDARRLLPWPLRAASAAAPARPERRRLPLVS